MSAFDFTNFERVGNIENDIQLDSIESIREQITLLTSNAARDIKLYTPDFEHELYNNQPFRTALLGFARDNRNARVDILVDDLSNALHEGHLIIPLAQQLSSSIKIKDTAPDYQGLNMSFILFDQSKFIFRPDRSAYYAIYSECRHRANRLLEFFTPAWEQSALNVHARQFII